MNNSTGLDILFVVSPPNSMSRYMPFYFLYLAGYLEKNGFRAGIVDLHEKRIDVSIDKIIREIQEKKPRYVGLASFVTDYDVIVSLANVIKAETGTKIIVGNAHPSILPSDFLYINSPFDIVVRGEGELTLKEVLEEYDPAGDNTGIKGIAYLADGKIQINANREFMDLKECGMPAYRLIDMEWYAKPSKLIIRRLMASSAMVYTSRGCPYNCGFCASNTVWNAMTRAVGGPPLVRRRQLSEVMEELELLQNKYRFDFFYIMDDTFGMVEDHIIEFCDAYRKSGLKMLWAAETRVNCLKNEDILRLMKEAGCIQLDFGVETGSPKLLEISNKRTTVDETINAFSLCKESGIRTFANMLLNLPEETEEDIEMSHKLLGRIKPTYVSVGVTQPYPGTQFYEKYLKVPIPKEQYSTLCRLAPSEEYRMSRHKIDFNHLLHQWQIKYWIQAPVEISIFKADKRYCLALLRSPRKIDYLMAFIKELCKMPLVYVRYWWRMLRYGTSGLKG